MDTLPFAAATLARLQHCCSTTATLHEGPSLNPAASVRGEAQKGEAEEGDAQDVEEQGAPCAEGNSPIHMHKTGGNCSLRGCLKWLGVSVIRSIPLKLER